MVSFLRKSRDGDVVVFVVNATPVVRYNYRLGVPESGFYREVINTDGETYGGSNVGNFGGVQSEASRVDGPRTFDPDSFAAVGDCSPQAGKVIGRFR